jgi:hypothetical protein
MGQRHEAHRRHGDLVPAVPVTRRINEMALTSKLSPPHAILDPVGQHTSEGAPMGADYYSADAENGEQAAMRRS